MAGKNLIKLSKSRIETLESCTWQYYCKYILKIFDLSNSGAKRGNICHSLLEHLLKPKRRNLCEKIIKEGTILSNPVISRYVYIRRKIEKLEDKFDDKGIDNLDLIDKMILVALKTDFFCEKEGQPVSLTAEGNFNYKTEKYEIVGIIDKLADYGNGNLCIKDYKTSKEKYTQKNVESDLQALMYIMFAKKVLKAKKASMEFIFLRFPKDPSVKIEFSNDQIEGLEFYLENISNYLQDFDISKAKKKFAIDITPRKNKFEGYLLCNKYNTYPNQLKKDGSPMWCCSYKWPRNYYETKAKSGRIVTAETKEELENQGFKKIIKKKYLGCPRWNDYAGDPTINL